MLHERKISITVLSLSNQMNLAYFNGGTLGFVVMRYWTILVILILKCGVAVFS